MLWRSALWLALICAATTTALPTENSGQSCPVHHDPSPNWHEGPFKEIVRLIEGCPEGRHFCRELIHGCAVSTKTKTVTPMPTTVKTIQTITDHSREVTRTTTKGITSTIAEPLATTTLYETSVLTRTEIAFTTATDTISSITTQEVDYTTTDTQSLTTIQTDFVTFTNTLSVTETDYITATITSVETEVLTVTATAVTTIAPVKRDEINARAALLTPSALRNIQSRHLSTACSILWDEKWLSTTYTTTTVAKPTVTNTITIHTQVPGTHTIYITELTTDFVTQTAPSLLTTTLTNYITADITEISTTTVDVTEVATITSTSLFGVTTIQPVTLQSTIVDTIDITNIASTTSTIDVTIVQTVPSTTTTTVAETVTVSRVNLVQNPNFAVGNAYSTAGWTSAGSGNTVSHASGSSIGTTYVFYYVGVSPQTYTLSQSLATVSGITYTVSFWWRVGTSNSALIVTLGSDSQTYYAPSNKVAVWIQETFTYQATSSSSELSFEFVPSSTSTGFQLGLISVI